MTATRKTESLEVKFRMDEEGGTGSETPSSVAGKNMDLVLNKILYNVVGYHSDDTPIVKKLKAVLSARSNKRNRYIHLKNHQACFEQ